MAKKVLPSQAMKKMNTLSQVAKKSQEFKKEIIETENVQDLPEDVRGKIIMLPDEMLLDDPFNLETYGENDVEEFAEIMRKYGFRGVVIAYPYEDKYMIESGHRRREAGRRAGIKEIPTFLVEPPKSEWERRLNLMMANLNNRDYTPMIIARVAQGTYEAQAMKIADLKEKGELQEGENTNLNELTAEFMRLDSTTVELYRRLLKLIPELQELADDKRYSWSAIAYASNMSETYQKKLFQVIVEKTDKDGVDAVTKAWIKQTIQNLKLEEKTGKIAKVVETKEKPTRVRRKDGTKIIMNCTKSLKEVLENDAIIRDNEVETVVKTLKELQKSIEKKITELTK